VCRRRSSDSTYTSCDGGQFLERRDFSRSSDNECNNFGGHIGDIRDTRRKFGEGDYRGLKQLDLEDQLKYIPEKYRRGQVCNDVDIQRRQQQYERCAIPDRYTTTVGVENQWNN